MGAHAWLTCIIPPTGACIPSQPSCAVQVLQNAWPCCYDVIADVFACAPHMAHLCMCSHSTAALHLRLSCQQCSELMHLCKLQLLAGPAGWQLRHPLDVYVVSWEMAHIIMLTHLTAVPQTSLLAALVSLQWRLQPCNMG